MTRSPAAARRAAPRRTQALLRRTESATPTRLDRVSDTDLGARIHHLRQHRGLIQMELATLLAVSPSTISLWERNRRHPEQAKLADVAAALRVPLADLASDRAVSAAACADEILADFSLSDRLLLTQHDYEAICEFIELRMFKRRSELRRKDRQAAAVPREPLGHRRRGA